MVTVNKCEAPDSRTRIRGFLFLINWIRRILHT